MEIDEEKLQYLFRFMEEYLCLCINEVLNDSTEDPHFSAVAVSNMIKCYISIEEQMETNLPYKDVKTYFAYNVYTEEEYQRFETSRKREAKYYKDIQY